MIIFDFDGVIVDTFSVCYGIRNKVHPISEEEYRAHFEGNINEAIKKINKPILNFWDQYIPLLMGSKPNEDMVNLIKKLSKKYSLAIVSSSISQPIKSFLESCGIDTCFEDILGNDVDHSKVKKLQMILDKHKVQPADVVFVTDTLGDIKEGQILGIKSIAVTWGFHHLHTLQKGNPYRIVTTQKELFESIEEYFQLDKPILLC